MSKQDILVQLEQDLVIRAPLSARVDEHADESVPLWIRVKPDKANEVAAELRALADAVERSVPVIP